ncbi:tetratricopeptide repeat protein [Reichenbachiella versicolor]|uniref:tetratricopeptide repeat protein n=1 Tax=Reichenbachiella versicolor TaxID=1821036 RepID=UPI0013A55323|nr:tetratricopeptide repeat protein [Reichenbachiella versicolor]
MNLKQSALLLFILMNTVAIHAKSLDFETLKAEATKFDSAQYSIRLLDEHLSSNSKANISQLADYYYLVAEQFFNQQEYPNSLSYIVKSRELVIDQGDMKDLEFKINHLSANINFEMNNFVEAEKQLRSALSIAKNQGNESREVHCLYNLGLALRSQGKYEGSTDILLKCHEKAKKLEINEMISSALNQLGWNSEDVGDLEMAAKLYYESGQIPDISEETIAISELNLGHLNLVQKKYRRAIILLSQAKNRIDKTSKDSYIPLLNNLGRCYYHLNQYDSALMYLNKAFHLNLSDPTILAYHPIELKESCEYLDLVAKAKNDKYLLTDLGVVAKMVQYSTNQMVNLDDVEKINAKLAIQDHEIELMNREMERNYQIWVVSACILLAIILATIGFMYFSRRRKKMAYKSLLDEIDQSLDFHR